MSFNMLDHLKKVQNENKIGLSLYDFSSFSADVLLRKNKSVFDRIAETTLDKITNDSGMLLARELEFLMANIDFAPIQYNSFFDIGLTIDNSGLGAERITWLQEKASGKFEYYNSGKDGYITVSGDRDGLLVHYKEAKYILSWVDLLKQGFSGRNISQAYNKGVNEIYTKEVNDCMLLGINGSKGLLNSNDLVTSAGTNISSATGNDILDYLQSLFSEQLWDISNGVKMYGANRMIISPQIAVKLDKKITTSTGIINETVREAFTKYASSYVKDFKIVTVQELHNIDDDTTDDIILMSTNTAVASLPMPLKNIGTDYSSGNQVLNFGYGIGGVAYKTQTNIRKTGLLG